MIIYYDTLNIAIIYTFFFKRMLQIPYLVELAIDAILASVTAKLETTGK